MHHNHLENRLLQQNGWFAVRRPGMVGPFLRRYMPAINDGKEWEAFVSSRRAYLIDDPTMPASLKVVPLLVADLGSIAAFPGENAPIARAFLETLAGIPTNRDGVLAMVDRRTADCFAHPEDEEIWIYTAEMLRAVSEAGLCALEILSRSRRLPRT